MKFFLLVVLFGAVLFTAQGMVPLEAETLLRAWVNTLANHPFNLSNPDACGWFGVQCNASGYFEKLDLDGSSQSRAFTMSGPVPDLPAWKASGAFPGFQYIYIRGARFGPDMPAWFLDENLNPDYWYIGWNHTTTNGLANCPNVAGQVTTCPPLPSSLSWKIWLPYFLRQTDSFGNYQYFCDPCGTGTTGLGCDVHPGCVPAFLCNTFPWNLTTVQATDRGLFCTNLNLISRAPTHGPIAGGTKVKFVMTVPAQYYRMQCQFGDDSALVDASNFQFVEYFPRQNMLMSFECTSPAHPAGTVQVHVFSDGKKISDIPVPFDYECPEGTENPPNPEDECIKCSPGYYSDTRDGSCKECPTGTYSELPGAVTCTPCPDGTVSVTPRANSSAACIPCSIGYYWQGGACLPCPSGTFTDKTGQLVCKVCSLGQYSAPPLAGTRCFPCSPGQRGVYDPISGYPVCIDCPPDTFTPSAGMTECIGCAPGRFQEKTGQDSCTESCPPGTYARGSNVTQGWNSGDPNIAPLASESVPNTNLSCIPCPPGYFSDRNSSTVCKPCPLGYISSQAGSTSCIKCPSGQTTVFRGSIRCTDIPQVVAPGTDESQWLAIVLAIIAAVITVLTISYVIYKRKQQAKLRKQIEDAQESAAF